MRTALYWARQCPVISGQTGIGQAQPHILEFQANNNDIVAIPAELHELTNATTIRMVANQLQGWLPVSMGNLSELTHLDLQGNELSGAIPATFGDLSNLVLLKPHRIH